MSEVLRLVLPKLSFAQELYASAGLRPHRVGGIRMEEEVIGNKKIYHNYGHGGGGVSMSYGCAKISTNQMIMRNKKDISEVAILGSGYMGLFTSKLLAETGVKVTVYTQKLPFESQTGHYEIASEAAAGFWMPYGYDLDENNDKQKDLHDLASKVTYDYFLDCMKTHRYTGLKRVKALYINSDPNVSLKKFIPDAINLNIKEQTVIVNNGQPFQCYALDSFFIEHQRFMKELLIECHNLGVKFVKQPFESLQDVLNLKQSLIFNCLGLGSGKVFNDKNLEPTKGQISWVQPIKDFNYYIHYTSKSDGKMVTTYPLSFGTGIGITRDKIQNVIPTVEKSKELLNNYNDMVTVLETVSPKL